ncbi:MAG: hypothetical protein KDC38_12775 [Planctomycetes bacterium]|nr:hypothetical protein [Planctomycetota bacterium]
MVGFAFSDDASRSRTESIRSLLAHADIHRPTLSTTARDRDRDRWTFDNLAGRTVEIRRRTSARGEGLAPALTAASRLILEAQRLGEPCVWIAAEDSLFFPPDFAAAGVDLAALPIVWVGGRSPQSGVIASRAADLLLRSGGFGLVVLDLGARGELSIPIQTRLSGLARHHHAVLLVLTRPAVSGDPSSVHSTGRGRSRSRDDSRFSENGDRRFSENRDRRFSENGDRRFSENGDRRFSEGGGWALASLRAGGSIRRTGFDRFVGEIHIEKDKRRSAGWRHIEICRGPGGMC